MQSSYYKIDANFLFIIQTYIEIELNVCQTAIYKYLLLSVLY